MTVFKLLEKGMEGSNSLFVQDEDLVKEQSLSIDISNRDNNLSSVSKNLSSDDDEKEHLELKQIKHFEQKLEDSIVVNSSLALKYQQIILEEMLSQDSLLVLAKGLGLENIISNLLHVLSSPIKQKRSLIILLNASDIENTSIGEDLTELSWFEVARQFLVIKGESVTVNKRSQIYEHGGIISISSTIFIVDLLSRIVDPNLITGLVVLHAERIIETSNESFIINYYKKYNKWGFIKCVTDESQSLLPYGMINPLQLMLRNMKLEKVLLWPRFHINVVSSLNFNDKGIGKIIEIKVSMTESMQRIQIAILSCLKSILYEIKRHNPEITAESELFLDLNRGDTSSKTATNIYNEDEISKFLDDYFISSIMLLFHKSWHRISWTTKQLLNDLGMLKRMLLNLISMDSVSFYEEIEMILNEYKCDSSNGRLNYNKSPWLLLDEANTVISFAKKRVFDKIKLPPSLNDEIKYHLEELPKWEQIEILIDEIFEEKLNTNTNDKVGEGPVLIMCNSQRTVNQIRQYLKLKNGRKMMLNYYKDYRYWKTNGLKINEKLTEAIQEEIISNKRNISSLISDNTLENNMSSLEQKSDRISQQVSISQDQSENDDQIKVSRTFNRDSQPITKRRRTRGAAFVAQVADLHKARFAGEEDAVDVDEPVILSERDTLDENEQDKIFGLTTEHSFDPIFDIVNKKDEVVIDIFSDVTDSKLLNELLPSHIIMYEPNLSFIRRLEIFQAENRNFKLKTFLMYYGTSVEEQRYLGRIKKEKEAFTRLIKEKSNLSKEFRDPNDEAIQFKVDRKKLKKNTRIAGGGNDATNKYDGNIIVSSKMNNDRIVVDIREFRSSLPNILFRSGFEVVPCVITVGDYVLSPKIVVERKSVPDLIGSFEKGNLYLQCQRMFKYYDTVILLIEFDENKSFSLNPFVEFKNKYSSGSSSMIKNEISSEKSLEDIKIKLIMLVLKYPQLRIIWSPSPYKTAEIFKELKADAENPSIEQSLKMGDYDTNFKSKNISVGEIVYNDNAIELLNNIPGINSDNFMRLTKFVKNIKELVSLEAFEICMILGEENGKKVFNFINQKMQ